MEKQIIKELTKEFKDGIINDLSNTINRTVEQIAPKIEERFNFRMTQHLLGEQVYPELHDFIKTGNNSIIFQNTESIIKYSYIFITQYYSEPHSKATYNNYIIITDNGYITIKRIHNTQRFCKNIRFPQFVLDFIITLIDSIKVTIDMNIVGLTRHADNPYDLKKMPNVYISFPSQGHTHDAERACPMFDNIIKYLNYFADNMGMFQFHSAPILEEYRLAVQNQIKQSQVYEAELAKLKQERDAFNIEKTEFYAYKDDEINLQCRILKLIEDEENCKLQKRKLAATRLKLNNDMEAFKKEKAEFDKLMIEPDPDSESSESDSIY